MKNKEFTINQVIAAIGCILIILGLFLPFASDNQGDARNIFAAVEGFGMTVVIFVIVVIFACVIIMLCQLKEHRQLSFIGAVMIILMIFIMISSLISTGYSFTMCSGFYSLLIGVEIVITAAFIPMIYIHDANIFKCTNIGKQTIKGIVIAVIVIIAIAVIPLGINYLMSIDYEPIRTPDEYMDSVQRNKSKNKKDNSPISSAEPVPEPSDSGTGSYPQLSSYVDSDGYGTYTSSYNGFHAKYPSDFIIDLCSDNILKCHSADDSATLKITWDASDKSHVESAMNTFIRDTGGDIDYKSLGSDYFAVRMLKSPYYHYRYYKFTDNVAYGFTLDFPATEFDKYDTMVNIIYKSIKDQELSKKNGSSGSGSGQNNSIGVEGRYNLVSLSADGEKYTSADGPMPKCWIDIPGDGTVTVYLFDETVKGSINGTSIVVDADGDVLRGSVNGNKITVRDNSGIAYTFEK